MHNRLCDLHMKEVELLYKEFDQLAPANAIPPNPLRNKLAGFFVVFVAAAYENCVREILVVYADMFHQKFSHQVLKKYERLNSRVKYKDLESLVSHFDGNQSWFRDKVRKISDAIGNEIDVSYDQIFEWRHAMAHANNSLTSLEEAHEFYRKGRYVIHCFEEVLIGYEKYQSLRSCHTNLYAFSQVSNAFESVIAAVQNKDGMINAHALSRSEEIHEQLLSNRRLHYEFKKKLKRDGINNPPGLTFETKQLLERTRELLKELKLFR